MANSKPAYLIKKTYESAPRAIQKKLRELRGWILEVANDCNDEIGDVEETLKWGAPSYLPKAKNVGTTVRIEWSEKKQEFGLYFHCQSQMISRIQKKFSDTFRYQDRRAIIFSFDEKLPKKKIQETIRMALRYHLKNKELAGDKKT